MGQEIKMLHGTDFYKPGVKDVLGGLVPLFSYYAPGLLGFSGSLTDSEELALVFALKSGRNRSPIILEYSIPIDLVESVGRPVGYNGTAYVTKIPASVGELTDSFLKNIEFTRQSAQGHVDKGILTFHKVPFQYFKNVVSV